jgi:superfamily II DNA or RNA helicase
MMEETTSPTILLLCAVVAAGTHSPSRCLAMTGRESLREENREVHRYELTCHDKYTKFIKNWSTHSEADTEGQRATRDVARDCFSFVKIRKVE